MIQRKTPLKRTVIKRPSYAEALAKAKAKQEKDRLIPKTKKPKRAKAGLDYKPTVSQVRKKADTSFSIYVRLRDAEFKGGAYWCRCITCGVWKPIKAMQAGHFQSRRYMNTRFHEQNVHAQCVKCNMFNQGEQYKYSLAVDKMYGPGTARKLELLARQSKKFRTDELDDMIIKYKAAIKEYERKHNVSNKEISESIPMEKEIDKLKDDVYNPDW